jgi:hypothetical protein
MRAVMLAALCLATLALVPSAEAQPDPPQCVWEGPAVTIGPATVSAYCGEGPRVSYDPAWCTEKELC